MHQSRYLAFVTHVQFMNETARCQIVALLYSPHRPITRRAASNKLAEALSLGRPALVNDEMLIVCDLEPSDCPIAMPYERIATEAANVLRVLIAEGDSPSHEYRAKCSAARQAYEELYSWTVAAEAMRASLLDSPFREGQTSQ